MSFLTPPTPPNVFLSLCVYPPNVIFSPAPTPECLSFTACLPAQCHFQPRPYPLMSLFHFVFTRFMSFLTPFMPPNVYLHCVFTRPMSFSTAFIPPNVYLSLRVYPLFVIFNPVHTPYSHQDLGPGRHGRRGMPLVQQMFFTFASCLIGVMFIGPNGRFAIYIIFRA